MYIENSWIDLKRSGYRDSSGKKAKLTPASLQEEKILFTEVSLVHLNFSVDLCVAIEM